MPKMHNITCTSIWFAYTLTLKICVHNHLRLILSLTCKTAKILKFGLALWILLSFTNV